MYCFSLRGGDHEVFAMIEYTEETTLNILYEKDIPFVKKLLENYYRDCLYSKGELLNAQRDLMRYMKLSDWEENRSQETLKQMQLIYKLIAIVTYALQQDCDLLGNGD